MANNVLNSEYKFIRNGKYTIRIYNNGDKEWFVNGLRHREDGPACEWHDGAHSWWQNGRLHRIGGPAVYHLDGSNDWWVDGELHRTDGPAIDRVDGNSSWYYKGKYIHCNSQEEFERLIKLKAFW